MIIQLVKTEHKIKVTDLLKWGKKCTNIRKIQQRQWTDQNLHLMFDSEDEASRKVEIENDFSIYLMWWDNWDNWDLSNIKVTQG